MFFSKFILPVVAVLGAATSVLASPLEPAAELVARGNGNDVYNTCKTVYDTCEPVIAGLGKFRLSFIRRTTVLTLPSQWSLLMLPLKPFLSPRAAEACRVVLCSSTFELFGTQRAVAGVIAFSTRVTC